MNKEITPRIDDVVLCKGLPEELGVVPVDESNPVIATVICAARKNVLIKIPGDKPSKLLVPSSQLTLRDAEQRPKTWGTDGPYKQSAGSLSL